MTHLSRISIHNLLPAVFLGQEEEAHIASSEVWLRESFTFERGKHYLIHAESGTGKSSLCAFIYGLRRDYHGKITMDQKDIRSFSIADWCRLREHSLAYLPQDLGLFPELTVWENLLIKNNLTGFRTTGWIESALEELEVADKRQQPAAHLSIGQQQRVAIVRALCQPFDFLLIDEPVSHLDQRNNAAVGALIAREAREQGAAIIATSVGNDINLPIDLRLQL
ncbi:MAG: ATP-binding cassette domain-containing protein [Bacteroidales bacterium]|nr:ATP-binding cassette domain-containing protein [Bacteroidales bacterium]